MRHEFINPMNVASIFAAALFVGFAAGFPLGYLARQVSASTSASQLAVSVEK